MRLLAASLLATTLLAAPALAQDKPPADVVALAPVQPGKLTDAAKPTAYRLDLTVDPAKERFSGHTAIDLALKAPSRFVDLHGRDLTVSKVTATVGGRTLTGRWYQLDDSGNARVVFAEALPAGSVTLAFDYDAAFTGTASGLFHVKVADQWYVWSQLESVDARGVFPSLDEPGFKQPFTVTIRTPAGLKAVSNAPEVSTTEEGGMTVHRFAQTLPLPTYLVALMAGPFATVEGTVPPTPQRATPLPLRVVSTQPNAARLDYALAHSKEIVAHLENYFGMAFPYPKLDQITSPVMGGAMENAGADLYQDALLVMDSTAPVPQQRAFGMVVSHELAHQWFGDLVTPAWWDDIWLNESFANWMGFRIGGEWRPDLNIAAGGLIEGFEAMNTDALVNGRPIHQPIATTNQIDSAFDSITYGKGGHVVAMIAAFMGDTKFRDGVRGYMAAHKYGNATSAEFFGAMAKAAGDPRILPAMQSFTDQQGVPLVTFARGKGGRWTVTQSRYARLGVTPPATRWGIPLCPRVGARRSCTLMTEASMPLTLAGSGVLMPNAGGTGYYRFELPRAEWDKLIAQGSRLSAVEAVAMSDSIYASFLAGRASPDQLIAAARTLARNPDSHASEEALSGLSALDYRGLLSGAGKAGYQRLVRELTAPGLKRAGFDPRRGAYAKADPEVAQQRAAAVLAMAGDGEDAALRATLSRAAQAWLAGDAAALDPAYYNAAFRSLARGGGITTARTLVDKGLASEDTVARGALLGAAASNGDAATAKWLLEDFADKRLRTPERITMIQTIVATPATREQGYAWLRANLDVLSGGQNGIFVAARLPAVFGSFCDTARANELDALMPRYAGKTGELEMARAIERVRSCGTLKTARAAELNAALAKVR